MFGCDGEVSDGLVGMRYQLLSVSSTYSLMSFDVAGGNPSNFLSVRSKFRVINLRFGS